MILKKAFFEFVKTLSGGGHQGPLHQRSPGETMAQIYKDQNGETGEKIQFNLALAVRKGTADTLPAPRALGEWAVIDPNGRGWRLRNFLQLTITPAEGEAVTAFMDGYFWGEEKEFGEDNFYEITHRSGRGFLFDAIPDGDLTFTLRVNPEIAQSEPLVWTGVKNITDITFDTEGPVSIGEPSVAINP